MKNMPFWSSRFFLLGLASYSVNVHAYQSNYESIQWDKRGSDTFYCLDITDANFQINPWLQALQCGDNFYQFSPRNYLSQVMKRTDLMPGTQFGWRVWSQSGYGGSGYEGVVTVQGCTGLPYASTSNNLQWGCRSNDNFYCVDILNAQGGFVKQAAFCNDGLHSFSPSTLNLGSGDYKWKVWSSSGYGGNGFEGQFNVAGGTAPTSACGNFSANSAEYNKCQTERLIGTWKFNYKITYEDRFVFPGPAIDRGSVNPGFYLVLDQQNEAGGGYEGDNATGYKFLIVDTQDSVYNQGYFFNLAENGNSGYGCYQITTKSSNRIGSCADAPITVTKISGFSAQSLPEFKIIDSTQEKIEALQNAGSTTPIPEMLEAIRQMLPQIDN